MKDIKDLNKDKDEKSKLKIGDMKISSNLISNFFDGKCGFKNLGNSCYMNSALQCIVHSKEIFDHFIMLNETVDNKDVEDEEDLEIKYRKSLLNSFLKLLKDIWIKNGSENSNIINVLDPTEIRENFVKLYSEFDNKLQHDCHEFITYLLDSLHQSLNRVDNKFNRIADDISNKRISLTKTLSSVYHSSHKKFNDSLIVDIFYGQLKSTITCSNCNEKRVTFDPFSSLGLSIPVEYKIHIYVMRKNLKNYKIILNVNEELHYFQIKRLIEDYFEIKIFNYCFYYVFNNTLKKIILDNNEKISDLSKRNSFLFFNEFEAFSSISNKNEKSSSRKKIDEKEYYGLESRGLSESRRYKTLNDQSNLSNLSLSNEDSNNNLKVKRKVSFRKNSDDKKEAKKVFVIINFKFDKQGVFSNTNLNSFTDNDYLKTLNSNSLENLTFPRVIFFNENDHLELINDYLEREANIYSLSPYKILMDNSMNYEKISEVNLVDDSSGILKESVKTQISCDFCNKQNMYCNCLFDRIKQNISLSSIFKLKDNGQPILSFSIIYLNKQNIKLNLLNTCIDSTQKQKSKKIMNIYNLLDFFTSEEEISSYNCDFCSNPEVKAFRKLEINRLPKILVLQLKRFLYKVENSYNKKSNKYTQRVVEEKNDKLIEFYKSLDVSKYMTLKKDMSNINSSEIDHYKNKNFELFAVCNHIGKSNSGHYTALSKHHLLNQWFEFDDKQVKKYEDNVVTKNAYLLFFSQINN